MIRILSKCLEDAQFFVNEGDCHLALLRPALAIASYSQALQIDASYFSARLKRGKTYLENTLDFKAAIDDLTMALQLNPGHIEARTLLDAAYEKAN